MEILCVEQDRDRLRQLQKDVEEIIPNAHITVCRDPNKAVAEARAIGCDILLTATHFDGHGLHGIMLAKQIQEINPKVSIIFISDHADTSAAYDAWKIGASAFLLRPYDKQILAGAIENPRFATKFM